MLLSMKGSTFGTGVPWNRVVAQTMRALRATIASMGMTSVTTVSKLFMIVTNWTYCGKHTHDVLPPTCTRPDVHAPKLQQRASVDAVDTGKQYLTMHYKI